MEKRKHYWNGRWGRLARLDILVFEDAGRGRWSDRVGRRRGTQRVVEFDDEDAALDRCGTCSPAPTTGGS